MTKMNNKQFIDERTGIVGRSNGSAAGDAFIDAMHTTARSLKDELDATWDFCRKYYLDRFYAPVGLFLWDGWFRLDKLGKAGDGEVCKGDTALINTVFCYQGVKPWCIGQRIAIIKNHDSKIAHIWEIYEERPWKINLPEAVNERFGIRFIEELRVR